MDYRGYIVRNPDIRFGKPTIKGTRITVLDMMEYLAGGGTVDTILEEWDYLSREQVMACTAYATYCVRENQKSLVGVPGVVIND